MKLIFSKQLKGQLKEMQRLYRDLEWGGYIIGQIDKENGMISCDYIYMPDQDVTGATVTFDPKFDDVNKLAELNQIGWLHSHNSMGVTPSGQDHSQNAIFVNEWGRNLMVIVNNREELGLIYQEKIGSDIYTLGDIEYFDVEYSFEGDIPECGEIRQTHNYRTVGRAGQPASITTRYGKQPSVYGYHSKANKACVQTKTCVECEKALKYNEVEFCTDCEKAYEAMLGIGWNA
jgi:proteasome lid subunit RPN8/RPN11